MKTFYAFASLLLLSGCTTRTNDPADVQAIKRSVDEFANAVKARNAGAAVSLMTDKTYYAEPHTSSAVGRGAVREHLKEMFQRFEDLDFDFHTSVADVQVHDDLGAARGHWILKARDRTETLAPIDEGGSWALVCRRQQDGSWKWDSVTINSSRPLPGMTAEGTDEKELIRLEQEMTSAHLGDAGRSRLGPAAQDRARALGSLQGFQLESMKVKDVQPHVFGDSALVTMKGDMQGTYNGRETSGTLHGVDFFVKRNGQWQLVYSQNTTTVP